MTTQPTQDAIVTQRADGESDDRMTATARKNLRTFVSSATFKCRADQSAALSCIDVLEERIDGLYDLITVLRDAIGAFPSHAEIEAATIERCAGVMGALWLARSWLHHAEACSIHTPIPTDDGFQLECNCQLPAQQKVIDDALRNLKGQTS